nr:ImmA/IrrE family metallo-endopeptidase [uncultured Corynebacterium sp.]
MIEALIQSAESRGYRIRWHRGGPKAAWIPTKKAITLQHGLDDVHALCPLAHELGHAHYGDPPGHHGAHEIRADRFAARLLISEDEYRLAEILYGPHPGAIAHELGVTNHLVAVWRNTHRPATPVN